MARAASLEVSSISVAYRDRVIVRGDDLCRDLIGHVGFTEYFLILVLGRRPEPATVRMVDAALVAIAEHGLVPSVQAARMTLSAAPNALQGAVAAGLLGCGEVILGAAETAGRLLEDIIAAVRSGRRLEVEVAERLAAMRAARSPLPGFGHPLHKPEDPRAWRLIEVARELGVAGDYVEALVAIHGALAQSYGRPLPLNVSGAIAATLLDAGFPLEALKGVPLVARAGGLVAHLLEEQSRPIGFRLADAAAAAISYDGPEFPAPAAPA
jgi:citrate synthase